MKHAILCLLSGAGLAGCAAFTPLGSPPPTVVDQDRKAAVERAAARTGVEVHWLHEPRKRATQ